MPAGLVAAVDELVRETGRTKQAIVTDFVADGVSGRALAGPASTEVCDLDEVAALLRVEPDQVLARVASDDLPGRCIGGQWRFSRQAVLRWLEGADRPDEPHRSRPGFAP